MFVSTMAKKKVGRPKMAKNQKKVGFSVKVKPELWKIIKPLKNRNSQIEEVLENNFIPNPITLVNHSPA